MMAGRFHFLFKGALHIQTPEWLVSQQIPGFMASSVESDRSNDRNNDKNCKPEADALRCLSWSTLFTKVPFTETL